MAVAESRAHTPLTESARRARPAGEERYMKEKSQIVENWLPRYTGVPLEEFGQHILLTNFGGYLGHFSRLTGAPIVGTDRPMPSATADGITMINFGMGSPNAATLMDLLSAIEPKAALDRKSVV